MTNKEKYKMAFSALQPSERLSWEAERMMQITETEKNETCSSNHQRLHPCRRHRNGIRRKRRRYSAHGPDLDPWRSDKRHT